ncbi:cytochrome c biogenesis protein CcdA [Actinocorallia lasiicapitis]
MSALLAAGIDQTVTSGSLVAAVPLAAAAGLVSFLSPCILPLVPGYLSYVTGLTGVDIADQKRGRVALGVGLFVAGFTVVFLAYGAFFGGLGLWLNEYRDVITRALGVLTIVFGLAFMGFVPGLQRTVKSSKLPAAGLAGAPLLGALFGIGWTPCAGPTLGAIQTLAVSEGSVSRGMILSLFYCVGLGVPFLLTAIAYRRALGVFGWVKKHYLLVMRLGGGMLVALGLLLVTGVWNDMTIRMLTWFGSGNGVI